MLYFLLLKDLDEDQLENPTILFFYKKKISALIAMRCHLSYECQQDAKDLSVFSFDSDLGVSSIATLEKFYNITSYPCLVIEDNVGSGF